jgi:hypothetical protein
MFKRLSLELEQLARMPPISYANKKLVLENLIAPVSAQRMDVAKEFLREQNWKLVGSLESETTYERGSTFGNMFSFHAENLRANALLRGSDSAIVLSVEVDTNFQILTVCNYLSLQAEMEDFGESVLSGQSTHRWSERYQRECGRRLYYDWSLASLKWDSQ